MKIIPNYKKIIFVLTLAFLGGCAVWENFTTYFNTYYNASIAFEKAEELMSKDKPALFEFKLKRIPPAANKSLDAVIKKCSKILQFHEKSSYFDDALFMLGRAFYFKQQFSKALRKFKELATIKNSPLALKNELWIGKTQLRLREYDLGMQILDDVKTKAEKNNENDIASEALIAQIKFLLYKENYDEAIKKINELLTVTESEQLKAEINYELGKLYEEQGNYEAALKAFADVQNYEPTYEIEFESRLEYAKLLKKTGKVEESLKLLEELSNENKFADQLDKIDLEIANIYLDKGQIEDAQSLYMEIDTTYERTESAGIADYKLGLIMENDYNDYDSAMYYYDRCLAAKTPNDIKLKARQRNKLLNNYLTLQEKFSGQMRKLEYLTNPESFVRDSLIYVEYKHKQDSIAQANSRNRRGRGRTRIPGGNYGNRRNTSSLKVPVMPKRPTISADSLKSLISDTEFELGNLFFGDLNVLDSAYYYYNASLKLKPNTPNKPKIFYAMGNYYLTLGDTVKADSLFEYIYNNYKYDKIVNEAARKIGKKPIDFESDPAEKIYLDAEKKYLAEEYNSAIKELLTIPKQYPNSRFAPQAYYTAGFILENHLYLPDSAASLYDSLVTKYRATPYTREVRPKLNFYKRYLKAIQDSIKKVREDSLKALMPDSVKTEQAQGKGKIKKESAKNTKGKKSVKQEKQTPQKNKNKQESKTKAPDVNKKQKEKKQQGSQQEEEPQKLVLLSKFVNYSFC